MPGQLECLRAEGEVYRLLSSAYYAPGGDFPGSFFSEQLGEALTALGLGFLDTELENLKSSPRDRDKPAALGVEYARLFRGPVKAQAYPYESMHVDSEIMGQSTLEVVRQYREAGLHIAADFKDLPDHISAELEFMSYLYARELEALQMGQAGEAARFGTIRHSFLENHLARWVPGFADLILQHASSPFYISLARLTREFICQQAAARPPATAGNLRADHT
ncbi:MAG: molecular chaperone TorD [Dehalococcoidia bacterium]|nr:molecular chaperone TorD [Dehalococcoidia bacterium]